MAQVLAILNYMQFKSRNYIKGTVEIFIDDYVSITLQYINDRSF